MSGISSFNLFFHVIKRQRGGLDGSVIFSPSVSRVDVGYFKLASFPVIKRQRGGSDRAVIFPPGVSRVDVGYFKLGYFSHDEEAEGWVRQVRQIPSGCLARGYRAFQASICFPPL
jgi:hypothetical protein